MARDTSTLSVQNPFRGANSQSEALNVYARLLEKQSGVAGVMSINADDKAEQEAYLVKQVTRLQNLRQFLQAWLALPDV